MALKERTKKRYATIRPRDPWRPFVALTTSMSQYWLLIILSFDRLVNFAFLLCVSCNPFINLSNKHSNFIGFRAVPCPYSSTATKYSPECVSSLSLNPTPRKDTNYDPSDTYALRDIEMMICTFCGFLRIRFLLLGVPISFYHPRRLLACLGQFKPIAVTRNSLIGKST